MKKRFKYETLQINDGNSLIPFTNYADATFVNQGTATIIINGFPLVANASITDPAFGDELNTSDYRISQQGTGTFILFVRVKIYIS